MAKPLLRPVLELRIHGVKNALPSSMLGVSPTEVRQVAGDSFGGFWSATTETADTPRNVHREAYSWGLLARTGGGALPLLGQLAVHLGWLFLLPFGLCNAAYWTRKMEPQRDPDAWNPGRGAVLLRVFGLGLTLLYTAALASVALDLLAVQCYSAAGACAPLSSVLSWLEGLTRGQRVALLALVPLGAMLLIYVVARRGRVQYEASVTRMAGTLAGDRVEAVPTLATPGFWSKARIGSTTERVHFAAVLLLLTVLLAWDRVYASLPGCDRPADFVANGCLLPGPVLSSSALGTVTGLLAAVALLGVGIVLAAASETPGRGEVVKRRRANAGRLLVTSIVLFLLAGIASAIPPGREAPAGAPFLGLVAAPQILLAVLLAISVAALGWRRGVPAPLAAALLGAALALLALPYLLPGEALNPLWQLLAGAAVVVQLVAVVVAGVPDRADHARTGWHGTGPGVVLLLALGAAMVLTSLLVVGARTWLGVTAVERGDVYAEFGVVLLAIVLVVGVAVGLAALTGMTRLTRLTSATVRDGGREVAPLPRYPNGRPEKDPTEDRLEVRVLRARRFAALAHRVEPVLGLLAAAIGTGIAVTLVSDMQVGSVAMSTPPDVPDQVLRAASGVAITVLGAVAAAAVATVASNALTHKERPVGVLWDLLCFLPRAGHPFGPPSYAERAVPELSDHIRTWLDEPSVLRRRVVVSAHSMGVVLAIATLFARYAAEDAPLRNVGLLTFGAQPRPYFGRFFPELFGPRVLGTRSSLRPSLLGADPWLRTVRRDEKGRNETFRGRATSPTLTQLLTTRGNPAWVSLWRRTDFLGFPVHSYSDAGNVVDRGASEVLPGPYERVGTHSDYFEVSQYRAALDEVVSRI